MSWKNEEPWIEASREVPSLGQLADRQVKLEEEVAHLHWALEVREGEVRHLKTQLGLVPAPGLFRGLWRLLRERIPESQAAKVRRMS